MRITESNREVHPTARFFVRWDVFFVVCVAGRLQGKSFCCLRNHTLILRAFVAQYERMVENSLEISTKPHLSSLQTLPRAV